MLRLIPSVERFSFSRGRLEACELVGSPGAARQALLALHHRDGTLRHDADRAPGWQVFSLEEMREIEREVPAVPEV